MEYQDAERTVKAAASTGEHGRALSVERCYLGLRTRRNDQAKEAPAIITRWIGSHEAHDNSEPGRRLTAWGKEKQGNKRKAEADNGQPMQRRKRGTDR